jgi:lipid A 4'-phosphatase
LLKAVLDFAVPVAILVALTFLIAVTGADLALARFFYVAGVGWAYAEKQPWQFLYDYGRYPCFFFATLAAVVFVAAHFFAALRPYRKGAALITLLTLLGPGLIISAWLKPHWGRPRPAQLELFGGKQQYRQVWEKGEPGNGASFPSLHAAAGFAMMAPFFPLRRSRPRQARLWLVLGACYGLLMGLGRMVQGGHFLSDVLWSGGIIYLLGLTLNYLLRLDRGS